MRTSRLPGPNPNGCITLLLTKVVHEVAQSSKKMRDAKLDYMPFTFVIRGEIQPKPTSPPVPASPDHLIKRSPSAASSTGASAPLPLLFPLAILLCLLSVVAVLLTSKKVELPALCLHLFLHERRRLLFSELTSST